MPLDVARHLASLGLQPTAQEVTAIGGEIARIDDVVAPRTHLLTSEDTAEVFDELTAPPAGSAVTAERRPAGVSSTADDVEHALAKAHERRDLNCFLEIFDDAARHRATELASRSNKGALAGVPFAVKDAFAMPGHYPSVGVTGFQWPAPESSTTVQRLEEAGAVLVGVLNLDPHCYTPTGFNPHFGRPINPHDRRFAVGGSSSGPGVAVAAGIIPFAIGTDTGGSVRIPASLCGVFGLKTTQGLIGDPGLAPLSPSQDTIGVLASSLDMIEAAFGVIAPGHACSEDVPAATARIGVAASFLEGLDDEVREAMSRATKAFQQAGASLVEVEFPPIDELNVCASVITSREAAGLHVERLARQPEFYPPAVRRRLLTAACVSEGTYETARRLRSRDLRSVLDGALRQADFLLWPAIRVRAPMVDGIDDSDIAAAGPIGLEFLRMNRPINYLGLPSLSIPIGKDRNGLPMGMQLIGRPHDESRILRLASQFQGAFS